MQTIQLIIVRHGESIWNQENRFTGWVDIDLNDKGRQEAIQAGKDLRAAGYDFDLAYTSVLRRAIHTLWYMLDQLDRMWLPTVHSWRLNERHYGALQGLNKAETAKQYGDAQVKIWRRSYDTPPPALPDSEKITLKNDPRYAKLALEQMPLTECLKDTVARVIPLWNESIAPALKLGKHPIIAAHGNSIRGLVKYLENISDQDIVEVNIPNGRPLIYRLDRETLQPLSRCYLGAKEQTLV